MGEKNLNYTIINHIAREKLELTWVEYGLADLVHNLSNNPSSANRWCYASKENLAKSLGVTRQYVQKMINTLAEKGLLEKHPYTKHLRTTQLWFDTVIIKNEDSKQSLHTVNKVDTNSKQSLHQDSKQSLHNNDIYNKDNYNKLASPKNNKSGKHVDNSTTGMKSIRDIVVERTDRYSGQNQESMRFAAVDQIKTEHQAYGLQVMKDLALPSTYTARIMKAVKNRPLHIIETATRAAINFHPKNIINVHDERARYFFKVLQDKQKY